MSLGGMASADDGDAGEGTPTDFVYVTVTRDTVDTVEVEADKGRPAFGGRWPVPDHVFALYQRTLSDFEEARSALLDELRKSGWRA